MKPESKEDPRSVYADIIDIPHWDPAAHPRMSLRQRAAQFAPYSALTGYADLVSEEARMTEREMEIDDEEKERISRKLSLLCERTADGSTVPVRITYFIPDQKKSGGRYESVTEEVRRVDSVRGVIVLARKEGLSGAYAEIPVERIVSLQISCSQP